jgi:pyrroloquinoline quinone (PQQ) biosynthesis protein C
MSRETVPPDRCPLLSFEARIQPQADRTLIELNEDVVEIYGLRPFDAAAALDEMRGDRTVTDIAADTGINIAALEKLIEALEEAGALTFTSLCGDKNSSESAIYPEQMVAILEKYYKIFKPQLFSGLLWTKLATGQADRPLFIGWLIETYFFIEAATTRFPVAIAACQVPDARRILARHFFEEYDHHHFLTKALSAAGFHAESLSRRTPLPGTMAVRNHMRYYGRRDTLAYVACSGFLESTGDDHIRSREFFEQLTLHFDDAEGRIIEPLAAHARLDENYRHSGMFSQVVHALGPVSSQRADAALEAVRMLVETLELWSTDILRHYCDNRALLGGVRRYRPLDLE